MSYALCAAPPDAADESWLDVPDWLGYQVSSLGRVRTLKGRSPRILAGNTRRWGYQWMHLFNDGRKRAIAVHTLVLLAFVGPRPEGMECRHLDGDPTNNRPTNLAWGTHTENNRDRVRHGTHHNAAKMKCDAGHDFTPENTYLRPDGKGRQCRTCSSLRGAARRAAA